MNINKLKRDPDKIKGVLKEVDGKLIALEDIEIIVPSKYNETPMLSTVDGVRVVAIFGIMLNREYYAVSSACTLTTLSVDDTSTVNIENVPYTIFKCLANSVVMDDLNLIRTGTFVYRIYKEFISSGNIPWYLNVNDMLHLFDTANYHGGANLQVDRAILELMIGSMYRNRVDRSKYWRHSLVDRDTLLKHDYVTIPLSSVALSTNNTTSKLMGNYLQEGLSSALTTTTTETETIEALLRS